MTIVEIIGYSASFFIMLSFLMKNMTTLRIINSVGCAFFVAYGFMLDPTAWPIIIPNVFICCINLYYLLIKKDTADSAA